jgi:hypothetical protein
MLSLFERFSEAAALQCAIILRDHEATPPTAAMRRQAYGMSLARSGWDRKT